MTAPRFAPSIHPGLERFRELSDEDARPAGQSQILPNRTYIDTGGRLRFDVFAKREFKYGRAPCPCASGGKASGFRERPTADAPWAAMAVLVDSLHVINFTDGADRLHVSFEHVHGRLSSVVEQKGERSPFSFLRASGLLLREFGTQLGVGFGANSGRVA